MYKKLLIPTLVLAMCALAQADTLSWDAGGDGFSWHDAANWAVQTPTGLPDAVPTSSDTARLYKTTFPTSKPEYNYEPVVYDNRQVGGIQYRAPLVNMTLTINNGASLDVLNRIEQDNGTAGKDSVVIVRTGATLGVASVTNTYALGRAGRPGNAMTYVYGTLNAGSAVNPGNGIHMATWGAGGGAMNKTYLTVYDGGLVDTYTLVMNTNIWDTDARIVLYGSGKVVVRGVDEWLKLYGYLTRAAVNGGPMFWGHGQGGVQLVVDTIADTVTIQVPEPATVALLGLGGLLLRRKR